MSSQRKFFGGRTIPGGRPSFDHGRMINPKYVPPSRHALFIRGLPSDIDTHKIRDFFQDAANSTCGIDFTSYNEELRKLCIALRFESHDIAKEMLTRFNNNEIFGHRVEVTWFKDLKKARDRMIDERRVPYDDHRVSNKPNRFDYDRRDNRDWSDSRRRFQPNNNNHHSRSQERGEVRSDISYGNNKRSSDYERSRSSIHSDKSDSGSEDRERRSVSIKGSKDKLSQMEKPSAYRVDIDETISTSQAGKVIPKIECSVSKSDNLIEDDSTKVDLDEKKKKKKKRKRRRMEHSGSQDSYQEQAKVPKSNEYEEKNDTMQFSAIAGDLNNWKQTASDSDDYLTRNNQICKSKTRISLSNSDKLPDEKHVTMLKMKAENIEKAYRKDSETYSSVVNVLIRTHIFFHQTFLYD